MSVDIFYWTDLVTASISAVILLLGAYRAIQIGRALASRVFRIRAYWIAALVVLAISALGFGAPWDSATLMSIETPFIFLFLLVILLFVDSNVAVAKELDFFHKDILHWQQVRKPFLVFMIVNIALILTLTNLAPSGPTPWWGAAFLFEYLGAQGGSLVLCAVVMVKVARTTYDATMKRFVRMLAYAVGWVAIYFTIWIPFSFSLGSSGSGCQGCGSPLGPALSGFAFIVAAYFFYRSAMSLSVVGKVDKTVAVAPQTEQPR